MQAVHLQPLRSSMHPPLSHTHTHTPTHEMSPYLVTASLAIVRQVDRLRFLTLLPRLFFHLSSLYLWQRKTAPSKGTRVVNISISPSASNIFSRKTCELLTPLTSHIQTPSPPPSLHPPPPPPPPPPTLKKRKYPYTNEPQGDFF